jgi:alcohol dehydrogenase (cytochrome c)
MRTAFALALAAVAAAQVPYERILNARREPHNWLTYSGTYDGQRYSTLDQINASNVKRLQVAWVMQSGQLEPTQVSPIVVDGVMYVTEPPNFVRAVDALTGTTIWTYRRTIAEELRLCCSRVNRGVAVLDDMVYYTAVDAHMVALDAKTGRLRWDAEMSDYKLGYSSTNAPLAVKGKVITGMAGGEYGVRGYVEAYDAKTGKRLWRTHTIPARGEKGVETWAGESWQTGSGTTWVTGSYDPENNLVIWGTGNPGPDWNGDGRKGDNLFSDSFVALDADTGEMKWYFQFTPHDTHDWDATQVPVLIDGNFRGQRRKMVATANRNGFYYVLDRANGKFLHARPYVKQTWATGHDDAGRPQVIPGTDPTENGNLVYPSLAGGTNWFSPSWSPKHNLFYVPAREEGAYYFKGEAVFKPGALFNGGGQRSNPAEEPYGAIRALETDTGSMKWEFRMKSQATAGILSTAGDLVVSATGGDVIALHAATGELLWRFKGGSGALAAPVTYMVNGKQYIAMAVGRSIFAFTIPD